MLNWFNKIVRCNYFLYIKHRTFSKTSTFKSRLVLTYLNIQVNFIIKLLLSCTQTLKTNKQNCLNKTTEFSTTTCENKTKNTSFTTFTQNHTLIQHLNHVAKEVYYKADTIWRFLDLQRFLALIINAKNINYSYNSDENEK